MNGIEKETDLGKEARSVSWLGWEKEVNPACFSPVGTAASRECSPDYSIRRKNRVWQFTTQAPE
jgi:hypothetical protein